MKQIIQDLKTGNTLLEEVPAPMLRKGALLIRTRCSLISLGTERMLVEFGKSNLISKARQQPDKVRQVLDKMKTEGILPTLEAVFNKLDEPLPLGYCNVGEVIAIGEGVTGFKVGDRVASNGHHAELVCVSKNLCARIPENVSDEEASFTVVGAIALQGIRLLEPTLGETVAVIGLGLIGLLAVDLLLANGCNVLGFDLDPAKVALAKQKGANAFVGSQVDVVKVAKELTGNSGCDGVLITASAPGDEIITQSAQMSRKRGRIVLVGVVGLNLQRSEFFKKELSFKVSCSYGPGRYDEAYEHKGIDYPLPYVRWTEQRNFEAVLHALSNKRLTVAPLITEKVSLSDYRKVYDNLRGPSIATILEYPRLDLSVPVQRTVKITNSPKRTGNQAVIGLIGAGNFTKMTVLPALRNSGAELKYIASAGGVTASALAKKHKIGYATTDYQQILEDKEVNLLLITTRHNLHARMVIEGLAAGKNVFVEKPLALNLEELHEIAVCCEKNTDVHITVGFNRRFSPYLQRTKASLSGRPINMSATMNAGYVPEESWVHDMTVGGGRIIGEACHYIDAMVYLTGSHVTEVMMSGLSNQPALNTDNAIMVLRFENGSQGVINYFSNGNKSYSKERIEVYDNGKTFVVDNFRKLYSYGTSKLLPYSAGLDKGHKKQFELLVASVITGKPIIPFADLMNTSEAALAAVQSMMEHKWITLKKHS